ncbi:Hypothetical protein UVM_LOCUS242 [uncultured virus]|nr:Hypothetical protein UVM_LOCUS242 [uncultured virus]
MRRGFFNPLPRKTGETVKETTSNGGEKNATADEPEASTTTPSSELFGALAQLYAADTVAGWFSGMYRACHGGAPWSFVSLHGSTFYTLLVAAAEDYMNRVSGWIQDRSDEHVNAQFDAMRAALGGHLPCSFLELLAAYVMEIVTHLAARSSSFNVSSLECYRASVHSAAARRARKTVDGLVLRVTECVRHCAQLDAHEHQQSTKRFSFQVQVHV